MAPLFPPIIEGILPAFYDSAITIPYSMNKAVGYNEISGFSIKVKTVQSNTLIAQLTANYDPSEEIQKKQIVFNLESSLANEFNIGQFYKIQMAYINSIGETGYYSTVGVIKYTTRPNIFISGLKTLNDETNTHKYFYTGVYNQKDGDISEKVYQYQFNIYDSSKKLIQTSGWLIHNSSLDTENYESIDTYELTEDLAYGKVFYIDYKVKTNNNAEFNTVQYPIAQQKSIQPNIKVDLFASCNQENGYIQLKLQGQMNEDDMESKMVGNFRVVKASDKNNFSSWTEIYKFSMHGEKPSLWSWKDYLIEQGVKYRYGLQQINDYMASSRIESNTIKADFEHAFLYDGQKQLKIKYNPKISSFKNTLLETKIDTIGSQFPFFFRNGNVSYKQFPISGLISYLSDEDYLFESKDYIQSEEYSIDLSSENIATERHFKLKVLEWLDNGQPKVFKSSTEGNYIVRLMNVSLSPIDATGRMLHNFSATAYEIEKYSEEALISYDFLKPQEEKTKQLRWGSVELNRAGMNDLTENLLSYSPAFSIKFEGMVPGDYVYITQNGINKKIMFGSTGSYSIGLEQDIEVSSIQFEIDSQNINKSTSQGLLTYAYYSDTYSRFDDITAITIREIPLQQFVGDTISDKPANIIDRIQDIKTEIQTFKYLSCNLRQIQKVFQHPQYKTYFTDIEFKNKLNSFSYDKFYLYEIYEVLTNEQGETTTQSTGKYYDLYKGLIYNEYRPYVYINNNPILISDQKSFELIDPKIKTLQLDNGVIADISYQVQLINYQIETTEECLKALKEEYTRLNDELIQMIQDGETSDIDIDLKKNRVKNAYNDFIVELTKSLKEAEEVND